MRIPRTRPVIGVFGSSDPETVELAEEIGYQIAARSCVLLTGGTGRGRDRVKDRAILGAKRAGQKGYVAAWVGVERTKRHEDSERDGSGLILRPGYEHKRNYVEAHLCDAAIALPGGEGTASEAAFCLVLRRPIVLVGPKWVADYRLSVENNAVAVGRFRKDTMERMSSHEQESPLDTAIADAYRSLTLPAARYLPLPDQTGAGPIVECVLDLVDRMALPGKIPEIAEFDTMIREYAEWLEQLPSRE